MIFTLLLLLLSFFFSQSNHERTSWGERNGVGGPPGSGGGPLLDDLGGPRTTTGNWRNREGFGAGGRRVLEENEGDNGWRKPRWRRGDEPEEPESSYRSSSGSTSRRLHRSWSEEENHDNIPEWARDNPSEESGTFDASGAFHGDDRSSKSRESSQNPTGGVDLLRKLGGDNSSTTTSSSSGDNSNLKSDHLGGSHSDRGKQIA